MKPSTASYSLLRIRAASSRSSRPRQWHDAPQPAAASSSSWHPSQHCRASRSSSSLLLSPPLMTTHADHNGISPNTIALRPQMVGVRWNTNTTSDAVASAVNAPFETHKSSATVRHQRAPLSLSRSKNTNTRPPVPGRLVRNNRRASAPPPNEEDEDAAVNNNDGSVQASGLPRMTDPYNDPEYPQSSGNQHQQQQPPPPAQLSRQEQRKAAIEKRRLFLERGVTSSDAAAETTDNIMNASASVAASNNERVGIAAENSQNNHADTTRDEIGIDAAPSSPNKTVEHHDHDHNDGRSSDTQQSMPRRPKRTPVHSLGNGQLSAADSHRLHMKQLREEAKERDRDANIDDRPYDNGSNSNNDTARTKESAAPRKLSGGGSIVASQSATARYRSSRRRQRRSDDLAKETMQQQQYGGGGGDGNEGGNSLKTNPSVVTIPLSDESNYSNFDSAMNNTSSDGQHSLQQQESRRGSKSNDSNFEERYQRLRRQRGDADDWDNGEANNEKISPSSNNNGGEESERSWSPFGWLWGKNKK